MNEEKFEELVNLYFDREITADEVILLKRELAASVERRRRFEACYRLHRATCSALSKEGKKVFERTASKSVSIERRGYRSPVVFGSALAACLAVLFSTTILISRDPVLNTNTGIAEATESPNVPYDIPTEGVRIDGNLSSQLRLAGLTPDISPSNQKIDRIETKVLQQREAHFHNMIEQMNQYRVYSTMPEPGINELNTTDYESFNDSGYLPAGFKSSLAKF